MNLIPVKICFLKQLPTKGVLSNTIGLHSVFGCLTEGKLTTIRVNKSFHRLTLITSRWLLKLTGFAV